MPGITTSIEIAASGMMVQSERMRVAAENIANSESVSLTPGGEPYRRKTIYFENVLNKELGAEMVQVSKIGRDPSQFRLAYEPHHPAADEKGYVLYPNVDRTIESQDIKEAQRSYEANLGVIEVSKAMVARTLDLLQ